MFRPARWALIVGGLCSLLVACGRETPAPQAHPPADGRTSPRSAPPGYPTPQRLTPTKNTLQHETMLGVRNGWGPVEVNRSNGERGAHDGRPLTLNGTTYALGFGTHAHSEMLFSLQGYNDAACTLFTAQVGVDDEVGNRGSVNFQVFVDGVRKYASGTMTGASATRHVEVDLNGGRELKLVVTDAGDGIHSDHADWANPEVTCVRQGRIIDYGFRLEPDPLCVPRGGGRVELTLEVTDRGISGTTLPSGPVSFKLEMFSPPDLFDVAEPHRVYTATTFPVRFPVAFTLSPALYGANGVGIRLIPVLEDADPEHFFGVQHRISLTLNTCP